VPSLPLGAATGCPAICATAHHDCTALPASAVMSRWRLGADCWS
jgi:hypothetical protein